MDEEKLIEEMLARLRFSGAGVTEPGYIGGARTTYSPFANLGRVTQGPSQYAVRAQDIMKAMEDAAKTTPALGYSPIAQSNLAAYSNPTGQVGTDLDTPFRNEVVSTQRPSTARPNVSLPSNTLHLPSSNYTYATGHTVIPADKTAKVRYGGAQQLDTTLTSIDNPAVRNQIMDARLEGENISLSEAEKRAGVVPTKRNVGEIGPASNTAQDIANAEKKAATQLLSDKNWTGAVKSIAPFAAKVAGPLGFAYDVLSPSQELAAADAMANPQTDFRVTQAYPSMNNVYTNPIAMAYAGVTPPGEEFGSSYAGPNTMNAQTDYDRVKAMFDSPVDTDTSYAYTGMGDLQSHPGQGTGYDAGFGTTGATYAGLMGEIANLPHSEVVPTKQGFFEEGSMIPSYLGKIASSKVDTYDVQNTPLYDAMVAINNQNPSNMPFDAPNVLGALTTGTDPLMDLNVAQDWANEINALRSGTWGVDPTTQAVTFEDYLTELGPASGPNIPFGKTTGTVTPTPADIHPAMQNVDYGAALADPNISAQATIDDFTERQIAQDMSSYPQFASTQETVPLPAAPVSAPMAPRQQAMPEVSIPDALARQDVRTAMAAMAPRQDAMPQAPAGPTPAQIAAQVAAAEQSHRDQQASARQALNDFYASREYQEGGGSAPAGMIEMASGVDTFASGNPFAEAMVAAQVNAAGGMEFGGAGGMAGSGRGGGGRGSRGGGRE